MYKKQANFPSNMLGCGSHVGPAGAMPCSPAWNGTLWTSGALSRQAEPVSHHLRHMHARNMLAKNNPQHTDSDKASIEHASNTQTAPSLHAQTAEYLTCEVTGPTLASHVEKDGHTALHAGCEPDLAAQPVHQLPGSDRRILPRTWVGPTERLVQASPQGNEL
jgi:hypothetical protein